MKKIMAGLAFGVMMLGSAAISNAASVNFDFSTGIGPDFGFYGGSYFTLDDSGGNLKIGSTNAPPLGPGEFDGGYVVSNFMLGGNFDIKVEYEMLSSWPSGTQIQLNTNAITVVRSLEGYQNYHIWDGSSWQGAVPTTDDSGVLEIKRVGNQVTGSYNSIVLYTQSTTLEDMDFSVCLQGSGWGNFPGGLLTASFDNFSITADYFVNLQAPTNPVPEPATMILFGAGLAGLAAVGRRRKAE